VAIFLTAAIAGLQTMMVVAVGIAIAAMLAKIA
jgi:hypothetical protein